MFSNLSQGKKGEIELDFNIKFFGFLFYDIIKIVGISLLKLFELVEFN
jgi:hypothetical protein